MPAVAHRDKTKRPCFIQGSFPKSYTGTTRGSDAVESAGFLVLLPHKVKDKKQSPSYEGDYFYKFLIGFIADLTCIVPVCASKNTVLP